MEKKKQHIISESIQLFLKFGVKSLTMEDIARKLGISKKTLYTYVKDKEDLLLQAVILFGKFEDKQLNDICSRGLNAIDESLEIKKWVLDMIQNIHPSVAYDIEKFHPAVSKRMKTSRHENVYRSIFQNIVKGQKEGLYRSDINADILAKLYIGRMESIFIKNCFHQQHTTSPMYIWNGSFIIYTAWQQAKDCSYWKTISKTIKLKQENQHQNEIYTSLLVCLLH